MTALGRREINRMQEMVKTRPNLGLHPGLLLAHGMDHWPEKGEGKAELVDCIARLQPAAHYRVALARWKAATRDESRFASFEATLESRLYIGVTRDHPLEAGITTSHSYGVPVIPGSAVKGLTRSVANLLKKQELLRADAIQWLFGSAGKDSGEGEEAEAGGLVFHDAWWCGTGQPFVAEVVTPHHTDYYSSQGAKPATDMDSPIPAPQIAVQGSFYFVVEGDPGWAQAAAHILKEALVHRGIGAKRNSGYGYMRDEMDSRT